MSTAELACTYASLILHDDGIAVTADKIATVLKAANVEVEPFWPGLFAKMLSKRNIDDFITGAAGVAAAPSAGAATGAAAGGAAPAAAASAPAAKEAPKKKQESESEGDMGMGLFD